MQDASWPPAVVCEPSLKDDWVWLISLHRHSSKSFCFLNGEVLFPKSTRDGSTSTSDENSPRMSTTSSSRVGATGINFTSPSCCFGRFYRWIVQPTSTPSWRGHFTLTFGICALWCALHFSRFERHIGRHLLFHKCLVTNANFAWLPSTKQATLAAFAKWQCGKNQTRFLRCDILLSNGNRASSNENTMRSMCDISQRLFEFKRRFTILLVCGGNFTLSSFKVRPSGSFH